MTRPYNPANRPILHALDRDRLADEARAFVAALPPRPFPWTLVGLWGPVLALWAAAAALAYLPAWMGY